MDKMDQILRLEGRIHFSRLNVPLGSKVNHVAKPAAFITVTLESLSNGPVQLSGFTDNLPFAPNLG